MVLAFVAVVPMLVAVIAIVALARASKADETEARQEAADLDAFMAFRDLQASIDSEMYLYYGWTEFTITHPDNDVSVEDIQDLVGRSLEQHSVEALADARDAAFTADQKEAIDRLERGVADARSAFLAGDYLALIDTNDDVEPGYDKLGVEADQILARHDYSWVAIQEQTSYVARVAAEVYGLATIALTPSTDGQRQRMALAAAETDQAYERFIETISDDERAFIDSELAKTPLAAMRQLALGADGEAFASVESVVSALGAFGEYFDATKVARETSADAIEIAAFDQAGEARSRYQLFVLGAVAIVIVPACSVFIVGRSLSRRLENLAVVAESLSNGELGARIEDEEGDDEIAVVTRAFNEVSATMAASYQQIRLLADGRYDAEILDGELPGPLGKTLRLALRRLGNSSAELAHLASHDRLTGLLDRRGLDQQLTSWPTGLGSIAVVDLDGFKAVNDTYGHDAGDAVLMAVAKRLRASCRDGDLIARLGGDEFVVATKAVDIDQLGQMADRIVQTISLPVAWHDTQVSVSASVGYTQFGPGEDYATSLKRADLAMYKAKQAGKSQAVFAPTSV